MRLNNNTMLAKNWYQKNNICLQFLFKIMLTEYLSTFNICLNYIFEHICAATFDVKKYIYHMACNEYDTQIAVVENQGVYENIDESVVRIYDVGRPRKEDDAVSCFYCHFNKHVFKIFFFFSGGR